MGLIHVALGDESSGSVVRYSWRRVRTAVHNLAVGTVWLENTGHTQEQPAFFLFLQSVNGELVCYHVTYRWRSLLSYFSALQLISTGYGSESKVLRLLPVKVKIIYLLVRIRISILWLSWIRIL